MIPILHTWMDILLLGGVMMLPLSLLAVVALAILIEKGVVYGRATRMSDETRMLIETYDFSWEELERRLSSLGGGHYIGRFLHLIVEHRQRPVWWIESRAVDEGKVIETSLSRRLWLLETIVTAAPLMGLVGTIGGMMHSFHLIGANGLVNPTGVTGGVAQALIATALGLVIALIALFGFNFFSKLQSQTLDEMERLGTRLIDQIRIDRQETPRETE
ncbi:MAG TPA: MotA/TolQ/ExbB proton channel family protein [Mariprofundaceae bacterium]|nr:MotA/TolQ/ExbB proton channel family protein [Mariprofundaceae bacterium]